MAVDAPDARAKALADKLMGRPPADQTVVDMLVDKVSVGQRDEEGKPVGERVSAEEYRSGNRRAAKPDDDDTVVAEDADDEEIEDVTDEAEEEGEAEGDDEEGSDANTEEDGDEPDEEEDDEGEDGDGEDDFEEVVYSDDDLISVKVDGEVREVSLHDLKRAYSLAGATTKRLDEATEIRKAAAAEREAVNAELQTNRINMLRTIQQLDTVLFAPLVPEPNPKLRVKNMQEYLLQKDAWEEDQKRIVAGRNDLAQFMASENQTLANARAEYRIAQQKMLAEKMPELLDPEKSGKLQKIILDAAAHYGVTPQQVAEVDHHGLFLMARDAARWLQMQKVKKTGGVPTSGETTTLKRRKRHLKSGNGVASAKARLVSSNKDKVAAAKKARASGKVDDVADMLMKSARTRGKSDGRRSQNV